MFSNWDFYSLLITASYTRPTFWGTRADFLWGTNLVAELLSPTACSCSTLLGKAKVSFRVRLIYTHPSNSSDGKAPAYNSGDPGSIPGSEDPLEKETATHSSIHAWKIPWTWWATGHGVAKSLTLPSDFTSLQ